MKKTENQIFTQERVNVTKRIDDGKTKLYTCKKKALDFAKTLRSYVYDAFDDGGSCIGYCVPK